MKSIFKICLILSLIMAVTSLSFSETARDIMQKNLERDDGDTMMAQVRISSCRITQKGHKFSCIDKPRIKVLEEVRKDYGDQGADTKQVVVIREPASENGIGFLQFDYGKVGKENDQWMYFSALGKVKRIVPGDENKPKTGSFFGTELNYEDIEKRRLPDYTYRLLREDIYRKRKCDVIESIPTQEHARKSNYSKIWDWIDKENSIRLKTILFDRKGNPCKQIDRTDIAKVNGIWTWRRQIVSNLKTKRLSAFKMLQLAYNFSVADEYLTQRALTDASFRERHLGTYRSHLN